jgi:alpha-tubulin suppressor-like RCC1 family protein
MKLRSLCMVLFCVGLSLFSQPAVGAAMWNKVLISAGTDRTFAIQTDGTLWVCGDNHSGALGLGDTNDRTVLTRVGNAKNWTTVANFGPHTLGLKADGTIWSWGSNSNGQLGLGSADNNPHPTPAQVIGTGYVGLAVGLFHSLALRADGSLWTWGFNSNGQLGLGPVGDQHLPAQVTQVGNGWVAVATGIFHSLGLKSDGSLYVWGANGVGQLGLGNVGDMDTPTKLGSGWVAIAAGGFHSFGLKDDGSLWAWGQNNVGQLGIGNKTNQNTPVQVGTGWVAVAAGSQEPTGSQEPGFHSLGLKSDGSLWAWGNNADGQLGQGNTINQSSPVRVGKDADWVALAAGGGQSLGLKSDGSLWVWGSGGGVPGLGNIPYWSTPTKVPRFNMPKAAVIPLN